MSAFEMEIKTDEVTRRLMKYAAQSPEELSKAMEKAALQFLTWANAGSANDPIKPPIRFGVLRGSSSAFVGRKLVNVFKLPIKPGTKEQPTPATSCDENDRFTATFIWNTEYATRMHEGVYKLGPFSLQDGNAGPKWLERHLNADKEDFLKLVAVFFEEAMGGLT